MKNIPFTIPDISEKEINNVIEVLRSGWITTGPKTKEFERQISTFCNTNRTVCLSSATAAMELVLRLFGIGPGDEVITSAYTYTASCSVINHVGAKIVLVDTSKDSLEIDYEKLAEAITDKTKAIIPVDIGGAMCDYDKIYEVVNAKKGMFKPNNPYQEKLGRILVLEDAAHAFGASYKGKKCGEISDFTCFSFHAVKNLTTAEGGAITWNLPSTFNNDEIYQMLQLFSLHGQNKDALAKTKLGKWEYDIIFPGYKCNMTDIMAAIGLGQLARYEDMNNKRREIIKQYNEGFKDLDIKVLDHKDGIPHLYMVRVNNADEERRNEIIEKMAEAGIACNVHFKPIPMLTAYKNLGFNIKDYPNSYDYYKNEITLPLHTFLTVEDVEYIIKTFKQILTN